MNSKSTPTFSSATEKLQKVLARIGLGSRRQIEDWIRQGRVKINHRLASIGDRISSADEIWLDGRKLNRFHLQPPSQQILCYHKPIGEICTRHDPDGRPTLFDRLPRLRHGRWVTVGRLDLNTAGLVLLTTDGELAHRLMHPSYAIEREYAVRVLGKVDHIILKNLQAGVLLEDGQASFKQIIDAGGSGANHWYHVTLSEGRNHEVKRLWESQGLTVSRLIRIRFGPIVLPKGLRAGQAIELEPLNRQALLQLVNLPPKMNKSS